MYVAYGAAVNGWARAVHLGETAAGMAEMRQGIEALRQIGINLLTPLFHARLGSLEAKSGECEGALGRLDRALAETARNENRTFDAELHRVRGEILLNRDPGEYDASRGGLPHRHRHRATAEGAELRATGARCRWRSFIRAIDRTADAQAVLAGALEGLCANAGFSGDCRSANASRCTSAKWTGKRTMKTSEPAPSPAE